MTRKGSGNETRASLGAVVEDVINYEASGCHGDPTWSPWWHFNFKMLLLLRTLAAVFFPGPATVERGLETKVFASGVCFQELHSESAISNTAK